MRTVGGISTFTLRVPTKTGVEDWEYSYNPALNGDLPATSYFFKLRSVLAKKNDIGDRIAFLRHECKKGYLSEHNPQMDSDKYREDRGYLKSSEIEDGLNSIMKGLNDKK
jgi:hypothetical protein